MNDAVVLSDRQSKLAADAMMQHLGGDPTAFARWEKHMAETDAAIKAHGDAYSELMKIRYPR